MPARKLSLDADAAELLRAVVDSAPVVVFALDAEGVFTLSEGRGLDALGLRPGEVVGRSLFDLYKDEPAILDAFRRAVRGETVACVQPVQGLVFKTHYAPRLDWGGKVTGVLGVATDVTETYHSLLAKDEFLSVISHELRTPLSSAYGWAWMLREEQLSAEETAAAVEVVYRNLEETKRLLQELRDASHSATGRMNLKVERCDLGAAVRLAAKSLAAAARAKGLTLDVAAPALPAAADKKRVRQIAWILLSNAVKFSPEGARVSVRLERRTDRALLTVADEGPGIPAALRPQLFDVAKRSDSGLPPRGRGLGLGLAIARRLAELHGGSLELSETDGRGAAFTLSLPLRPEGGARKRA